LLQACRFLLVEGPRLLAFLDARGLVLLPLVDALGAVGLGLRRQPHGGDGRGGDQFCEIRHVLPLLVGRQAEQRHQTGGGLRRNCYETLLLGLLDLRRRLLFGALVGQRIRRQPDRGDRRGGDQLCQVLDCLARLLVHGATFTTLLLLNLSRRPALLLSGHAFYHFSSSSFSM